MNLAKKYPVITDADILTEISLEEGVPLTYIYEWYDIWKTYIRHLTTKTSQTSILFPKLGTAYYKIPIKVRSRVDEKMLELKMPELKEIIENNHPYDKGHKNEEVYRFYGLLRKNEDGERLTLEEITKRQRKSFIEEHVKKTKRLDLSSI